VLQPALHPACQLGERAENREKKPQAIDWGGPLANREVVKSPNFGRALLSGSGQLSGGGQVRQVICPGAQPG
jgi:hypothetical protein